MSILSEAELAQLLPKIEDHGRWWFREHNPTIVSMLTKRGSFAELLGRVYFQGRADRMSWQVLDTVRLVLHRLGWEVQEFEPWIQSLPSDKLREGLESVIGPGKAGRGRDIDLTVGLIKWVKNLPDHHVSTHFDELLSKGQIRDLYDELQRIRSIGPKIASFVLRDFILGLELAGKGPYRLKSEEYVYAMPIDVHVKAAAPELNLPAEPNDLLARTLAELCKQHHCNPLLVNQGMFGLNYLGNPLSSAISPGTA